MARLILFLLAALCACAADLRVMSFNVRYPSPGDGENRWEARRDLLVSTIREQAPDLMGTQELFFSQGEYIVEKLPEYAWFGVSRRGNREDEHMGVFYRKDKLKLVESGNFWLSETPDQPGSMNWNVSLPRMVTWGVFESKEHGRFTFFNTHFPHRREDEAARVECAKVILSRIPKQGRFILTGDFNAPADGAVHAAFAAQLEDAWLAAPKKSGPEGSFHGFSGKPGAARIDWIFTRGFSARRMEALTRNDNGRYPSDHFPVVADFASPADRVRAVLDAQIAAWNRGDIPGFMETYLNEPRLTFIGAELTLGWKETLARYQKRYPNRAAMGTLSFHDLEIRMLGERSAFVIGRWSLAKEKPAGGWFTLLLEETPDGWKIAVDHTS